MHRPLSLIAIVTLVSTAVLSAQSSEIVGAVRDAWTQRVIGGAVIASLGGSLQSVRADSKGHFASAAASGVVSLSSQLPDSAVTLFGLAAGPLLMRSIAPAHESYLAWHRSVVFRALR